MEGLNDKYREFTLAAVSELSSTTVSSPTPVIARFNSDGGVAELRIDQDSKFIDGFNVDLETSQVRKECCLVLQNIGCYANVKESVITGKFYYFYYALIKDKKCCFLLV